MARSDYYASPFGRAFSAYMERPRLSRLIARTIWGGDVRPPELTLRGTYSTAEPSACSMNGPSRSATRLAVSSADSPGVVT